MVINDWTWICLGIAVLKMFTVLADVFISFVLVSFFMLMNPIISTKSKKDLDCKKQIYCFQDVKLCMHISFVVILGHGTVLFNKLWVLHGKLIYDYMYLNWNVFASSVILKNLQWSIKGCVWYLCKQTWLDFPSLWLHHLSFPYLLD